MRRLTQGEVFSVGVLRNAGRGVVADDWVQSGHQHQGLAEVSCDAAVVHGDADDAVVGEGRRDITEESS